ncbi:hypothetical protein Y032_0167g106 [Ancylostoma ceylanicum]|uniref:Glycosyltransferase family 92 protein n=2 Tax=Ancylostoma ceylanicum TaxID=53326 RepID=A0A016SW49_9BILA|nr:hypothetical protein Y032_0167g106 [Ancylostoma ceylanicum]
MSLTMKDDDEINTFVSVEDRTQNNPRYFLSLCLAPMYDDEAKWLMLAEEIEHYKLQGLDHFYLYVKDYDNYTYELIESYVKSGEAEVIHFRRQRDRPGMEWQLVGIQDCLQRSRHHSRYAIFSDLDERITPTTNVKLKDYVGELMRNYSAMYFRPRRILRTSPVPESYEGENTLLSHLPALVFTNTTKIAPAGTLDKCILDPTKVFIMDVHNIAVFFPGNNTIYTVPPEEAIIRHYRDINVGGWSRNRTIFYDFAPYVNTTYPESLLPMLYKNVRRRLDSIYL